MKFDVQAFLDSLPIMGWGMLGIFIVIGVMMVFVLLFSKLFPVKNDKEKK